MALRFLSVVVVLQAFICVVVTQAINSKDCGKFRPRLKKLIANGYEADKDEFPWAVRLIVFLKDGNVSICTGSLITPLYVLTAANCLSPEVTGITVQYGSNKVAKMKKVKAIGYQIHPSYEQDPDFNDLMVLKLDAKASSRTVCLPTEDHVVECQDNMFIGGFGAIYYKNNIPILPKVLGYVTLNCPIKEDGMLYIYSLTGIGLCKGDSGGSMVVKHSDDKYYALGVNKEGTISCNPLKPRTSIMTDVLTHVKWIIEATKSSTGYTEFTRA